MSSHSSHHGSSVPASVLEALAPLPPLMAQHAGEALPPSPATAPALRWGIIGAGRIAHKFVRDVKVANGTVVAVGSATPGRAEQFAREMAIPQAGSHEDVLSNPEVEAVYIATTHNFHRANALEAIAAGKAVLIEKPITQNTAELTEIIAAAEDAGVLVMEAMWSRFLPTYAVLRALSRSGVLGPVRYLRAEHHQYLRGIERLEQPELAGGATLDLGVYSASFAHWILGKPQNVQATGRLSEKGVDLDVAGFLTYPEASAIIGASMDSLSGTGGVIGGEHGYLSIPHHFYRPSTIELRLARGPLVEASGEEIVERWDSSSAERYGFAYEAAAFARAAHAGLTEVADHSWQDTREVMEILDSLRAGAGYRLPGEA